MRRLAYSLTFALVLLLASFAGVLSADVPGTPDPPGTIPANTVWLPVVRRAVWQDENGSSICNYELTPVSPEPGAINPYAWVVEVIGGNPGGPTRVNFRAFRSSSDPYSDYLDTWNSLYGLGTSHNIGFPAGKYCWRARAHCETGKGAALGPIMAECRTFYTQR